MEDEDVFAVEAADVAMKAIEEGVARINLTWQEAFDRASADIRESRGATKALSESGFIPEPPPSMIESALEFARESILSSRKPKA